MSTWDDQDGDQTMSTARRAASARADPSGGCPGPAGRAGAPLARFGPWLVLVWPPLLLGAFLVVAVQEGLWRDLVLMLAVCASFAAAIVVFYRPRRGRWQRLAPAGFLVLQAALTAVTLTTAATVDGAGLAFAMLPLVVITASVVLPPRTSPSVIVLVTAVTAAVAMLVGAAAGVVAGLSVTTLLSGMGSYVVHRLAATVTELDRTRRELADAAVAAERLRFSRDLHDLLGHTLSVIVVKAEAVRRLGEADPAAAAAHGADIETLGRSALAEVRDAVAGYREGGLEDELSRAAAALRAGGTRAEVGPVPPGLDQRTQALLGWVVREGVTNVLRHARAGTCRIRVDSDGSRARVTVADDGSGATGPPRMGAGLRGIGERVRESGGTFSVGTTGQGFSLEVDVPVGAAPSRAVDDEVASR